MPNRQHAAGSAHLGLPQLCLQLVDAAVLPLGMRDGLAYVLLQTGDAVLLLLQGCLWACAACAQSGAAGPRLSLPQDLFLMLQ